MIISSSCNILYSTKLWQQKTLADLADETLSANIFLPIILTTKNMEIFFKKCALTLLIKLSSIIFLIATSCSLVWPDLTAFLCGGKSFPVPTQKQKKAVWPRETIQHVCRDRGSPT